MSVPLSVLLKQADKVTKQNHYVQFPFGLMDVNSLRKLLAFYDKRSAQKQVQEEKKWLSIDIPSPHSEMFIPKSEMITFFSQIWNQMPTLTSEKFDWYKMAYRWRFNLLCKPNQHNNKQYFVFCIATSFCHVFT